ncbi:hypothetical protein HZH66_014237 [Vespula vulgaris]|uniref:Uncharacterized protein n=1 Tax=Vespula vulgaris TaxID=7454 RepID=A0A834J4A7_VESVU|nr:hypothetical protein HZH66_014237 [Vespula vulgaris]
MADDPDTVALHSQRELTMLPTATIVIIRSYLCNSDAPPSGARQSLPETYNYRCAFCHEVFLEENRIAVLFTKAVPHVSRAVRNPEGGCFYLKIPSEVHYPEHPREA